MKILSFIMLLLFSFTSLGAAAFEKEVKSRSAVVQISSEKPLVVGNNKLLLKISKKGVLSSDEKVSMRVFMPAMPGMPFMESRSDATYLEDGNYEIKVNFSMGGTWQMHIFVTPKSSKKYRVKTSVNL